MTRKQLEKNEYKGITIPFSHPESALTKHFEEYIKSIKSGLCKIVTFDLREKSYMHDSQVTFELADSTNSLN